MTANVTNNTNSTPATRPATSKSISSPVKQILIPSFAKKPRYITLEPTTSPVPSQHPTKLSAAPTISPSTSPSSAPTIFPTITPIAPSIAPSQSPSQQLFLEGSAVFFIASIPGPMYNETKLIFEKTTWNFTSSFLSDACIISNTDGLVNFGLSQVLTPGIDDSDESFLFATLKVNATAKIAITPSSSLSTFSFDLLLAGIYLSPEYASSLQQSSLFFAKASVFPTYATASGFTNSTVAQQEGAHTIKDEDVAEIHATTILLSVMSTIIAIAAIAAISLLLFRSKRTKNRSFNSNDVFYASSNYIQKRSLQQIYSTDEEGQEVNESESSSPNKEAIRTSDDDPEFSPYHSRYLNSTSSCKEADIVSGSQSSSLYYSTPKKEALVNNTKKLHEVPPMIVAGNVSDSDSYQDEKQFISLSAENNKQKKRINSYEDSPCNSSLSNSPAGVKAFAPTGTLGLSSNQNNESVHLSFQRPAGRGTNIQLSKEKLNSEESILAAPNQPVGDVMTADIVDSRKVYPIPRNQEEGKLLINTKSDSSVPIEWSYSEMFTQQSYPTSSDSFDLESYYADSNKKNNNYQRAASGGKRKAIIEGYKYTFNAPSRGKLGLTIESSKNKGPTIHSIKDYSPFFGMVSVGDIIIMIEGFDTHQMDTEEITKLLNYLRRKKQDGIIRITLLSPNSEKVDKIQARQDYLLENAAIILDNAVLGGQDEDDEVEESIHLLGSLQNGDSFNYDEQDSSFHLLMNDDSPSGKKVVILDERELPPSSVSQEDGAEESLHLLGGIINEGSYSYHDDGQESL